MQANFSSQQNMLSLPECERLCARSSREIAELAHRAGWCGLPGARLNVSVGTALDMLALSIGMNHGVELQWIAHHVAGLRNEALLTLGEDTSNWFFDGTNEAERQFFPMLYGVRDTVRPRVATLLGISSSATTRQLRFFSSGDVERLSLAQFEQGDSGRAPRFSIDAHDLAGEVRSVCGSPLFTAKVAASG